VTGKGLDAATYTAEIKFALRAFLREDASPATALERLNRFIASAQRLDKVHLGATYVAAAVVVVNTATGELIASSAGMEPPLLVREGRAHEALELTAGGPLLGAVVPATYETQEAVLAPGDILAITTDGITEARRAGAFFGLDGLAATVRELAHLESLAEIGQTVAERSRQFAGGKRQDDVCLLLARRTPVATAARVQQSA
jgi:serine phosphatase RsbU (regulator of sigma subunit)